MKNTFETNLITPELICSDLEKSLAFYIDALEFHIRYQREEDGFAMLERQGVFFMLEEFSPDDAESYWLTGPLEHPFGRGVSFEIKTDKVDALYKTVQDKKCKVLLPIEEKWYRSNGVYLGNRQFIVQDPDGYLLRFYEPVGTKKAV